jgi:hypothetical protein
MHHYLREISKVGVGLVLADLASVFWFSAAGFFPLTILGITWSASAVWPVVILDLALILLLAHYGWNMKLPIKSPTERGLLKLAGAVFLVVALLHLIRIAFGWNLIIAEAEIPLWVSWLGVVVPGYLSYASFHFALRK